MIEFHHVTRFFDRKKAVDDLCLTVSPGEIFALLGPNGAGKTTTIKMLTGLLRPNSGSIRVCGHNLATDLRQATRCIGYIPDEPFLYDKLSGREFLEFAAQMRGLERSTIEACIDQGTEQFDMGDYIDDLIETYSHGMKQRLVFTAALLHQPQVVVIDEPMVALDPRSIRLVKDLLHTQAAAGVTVLLSTHILTVAEEIADRIGILHQGQMRFLGSLEQVEKELHAGGSLESFFLHLTSNLLETPNSPASPQVKSTD